MKKTCSAKTDIVDIGDDTGQHSVNMNSWHAAMKKKGINMQEKRLNQLTLRYWTRRWESTTSIHLDHVEEGWVFHANAHSGLTDQEGNPHLFGNLNQDNVSFPKGVDDYLEYLWNVIEEGKADADSAQRMLNEIGAWISATESAAPIWKGWNC